MSTPLYLVLTVNHLRFLSSTKSIFEMSKIFYHILYFLLRRLPRLSSMQAWLDPNWKTFRTKWMSTCTEYRPYLMPVSLSSEICWSIDTQCIRVVVYLMNLLFWFARVEYCQHSFSLWSTKVKRCLCRRRKREIVLIFSKAQPRPSLKVLWLIQHLRILDKYC